MGWWVVLGNSCFCHFLGQLCFFFMYYEHFSTLISVTWRRWETVFLKKIYWKKKTDDKKIFVSFYSWYLEFHSFIIPFVHGFLQSCSESLLLSDAVLFLRLWFRKKKEKKDHQKKCFVSFLLIFVLAVWFFHTLFSSYLILCRLYTVYIWTFKLGLINSSLCLFIGRK